MTQDTQAMGLMLIPYFSYRDAAAALEWLTQAFSFRKLQTFLAADGTITHAEMSLGNEVIMLGTDTNTSDSRSLPIGHGVFVCVEDVDAHYEREKAAAQIVCGPEDTDFGTRRDRALDPAGNEWSFGTYRP